MLTFAERTAIARFTVLQGAPVTGRELQAHNGRLARRLTMVRRRDFLIATAGLAGAASIPGIANSVPCPPPTFSLDTADTVANTCVSSNAPAYISSLSPFEVRAMTGTYSPTNGNETVHSVMPAEWSDNDDIIRPWSGGPKPLTGSNTKLWVHGGGHTDSSNNAIVSFEFAGTTRPTGWTLARVSSASAVIATSNTGYSDGGPSSVHTYDGMCELNGNFYRCGGSIFNAGGFASQFWRYNVASNAWTRLAAFPGGPFGGFAVSDTGPSGKVLFLERWASYFTYAFYNTVSNTWGSVKSASQQWPDGGTLAYRPDSNPGTGTGLVTGAGQYSGSSFSFSINWSSETIGTLATRNLGELTTQPGAACFYDPATDRFWGLGGGTIGTITTINEINPANWSITPHTLGGDALSNSESNNYHGMYGRFVFLPAWRAFGTVLARNGSAFIIRLP
jgi:hypothetical protein